MNGARSWLALCGLHGVASLLLAWAGQGMNGPLAWRSVDWMQHPWTLWTSAWLHLNIPHLVGNLLALAGVAAAGWVLRPGARATLAWLLAWPLAQLSLLCWPTVTQAVGLSGLMHAGTLLLAVPLALGRLPVRGGVFWGGLLTLGALTKLALERGWSQPLAWDAGTGIWVVQAAHVAGGAWGLLLGLAVALWPRRLGPSFRSSW